MKMSMVILLGVLDRPFPGAFGCKRCIGRVPGNLIGRPTYRRGAHGLNAKKERTEVRSFFV